MPIRPVRDLTIRLATVLATGSLLFMAAGITPVEAASNPKKPCDVLPIETLNTLVGTTFTASKFSTSRECDWVGTSFKDTIVFQFTKSDPGRSIPQKSKTVTVAGHKAAFIQATKNDQTSLIKVDLKGRFVQIIATGRPSKEKVLISIAAAIVDGLGNLKPPI